MDSATPLHDGGYGGPRLAVAAAVAMGPPIHVLGDVDHLVGFGILLGAGALALVAASLRSEKELAPAGAQQAGTLLDAVLHSALECFVCMDRHGRIVEFNDAAERTFGHRRDEALGRELATLIVPPELRDHYCAELREFVRGGDSQLFGQRAELVAIRADGSRFPIELTTTCVQGPDGPIIAGFLRDM